LNRTVFDERLALRDTVRRLLSRESGSAAVRAASASPDGFDRSLWTRLCDLGAAGLAIPERYGGLGASIAETGVVLGELGRTLTPSPLLGSSVLTASAILACGDDDACRRLLPGIADGSRIAALVWAGPEGRWDPGTVACKSAVDSTLTGEAHYVLDGTAADVLVVAADTGDGLGLFEVDPGRAEVSRQSTMDLTRRLATVRLAGVRGRPIGVADLAAVRDVACTALAHEQVGAARRCLELTVAHTKTRVQFGRPIGGFQALKHRMADLHVLVETAESATLAEPAVAKVYCSETLCAVAAEMIQLHGGIAITWEHDAHLYLKRAHGSAQLFGSPREHLARLAVG
jgi:alkylation response protein AidB-like acyl-CoA dehydrogenase